VGYDSLIVDARNGGDAGEPLTPRFLTKLSRKLYARGRRLSPHEALTTVYRPLYTPFHAVLEWIPRDAVHLDVGCGTGSLLLLANALGRLRRGYGFEIQEAPLALARAANQDARIVFETRPSVPVDIIRASNVISVVDTLHHVPTDRQITFLRQLLDEATPGTLLIVKDLDPRPRWRAFANRVTDFLSTRSRAYYMAMIDVRALLDGCGFEILDARRLHRHIWSHYLIVGRKGPPAEHQPGGVSRAGTRT